MRALLTAFEPFGGEAVNASLEAVSRVPGSIGDLEIVTAVLPTSFARSLAVLEAAILRAEPDLVLCVGQARSRAALCVERVAINLQDARIADNDGAQPIDSPVISDGPPAYFATLPVKAMTAALIAAQLPAELSNSAGTFVCNHVFYGLMHLGMQHRAAGAGRPWRGGVLHVPRLPEQAAREPGMPSMALDDIVRGLGIALETAAGS